MVVRSSRHDGGVLWFTGLPSSGKTTLALEVEKDMCYLGYQVVVLDGDQLRSGLNSDLGFTMVDRLENVRRVGEVASLFAEAGFIAICALVSPYRAHRNYARLASKDPFYEIYIKATVETCEQRDVKGLYARARVGEILNFTGVSEPYEPPTYCALTVNTETLSVKMAAGIILQRVEDWFPLKGS